MKRLLPFIALVILVGLIASLPMILSQDRYRNQLSAHLSQRLERQVVIGKLNAGYFPPSFKLRDVTVFNPAGDAPLLQIELLQAKMSLSALLRGAIVPRMVLLKGWTATVHRSRDGRWAWDEWISPTVRLGTHGIWPLETINFDRGELRAVDPYGPGPEDFVIQVQQGEWERDKQYMAINGVFSSLPAPVKFLFQGSGRFVSEPEWSGDIALHDENRQWKMDWKVQAGLIEAKGHSAAWRFDSAYAFLRYYSRLPLPPPASGSSAVLENWKNQFNWQAERLSFTQSAGIAGGQSEVAGYVLFGSDRPTAHVDMALRGANVQQLQRAMWGSAPLDGVATGLAQIELVLSSAPWSSLTGHGSLDLKEGKYVWPEASGKSLAKAKTMKYLQKKYPNFLHDGLSFRKAAARWRARQGMVSFDDARINLGDIQVGVVGSYDAARRGLDAYVRVQINERKPELIKELPLAYVYRGAGYPQVQPMHGRLQGTPAEWRLRAVQPSKIPPYLRTKLSQTIKQ
jgi:hypothetical protein